mgnify:CR=1 FL=1|nr:hypothetical protein [Nitrosomonas nitrosa]
MRLNSSSTVQSQWIAMVLASGIFTMSIPEISIGQTIYVEPLHVGSEKGNPHYEYSDILRGILREKGLTVVAPLRSASGEELLPAKLPKNMHVVFALVLKQSTLHPGFLCTGATDSAPGHLTISARLRRTSGEEAILKDVTREVTLYKDDVLCKAQGMTKAAKQRIMREVMSPVADQVVDLVRK